MEPEYYYYFAELFYNSYLKTENDENNNPDTTGQAEQTDNGLDIYAS
jgi:hypothetical protein